jgi:hypothetical protein
MKLLSGRVGLPRLRVSAAVLAASCLVVAGCGSSSGAPSTTSTSPRTAPGRAAIRSVERALVSRGGPPRPASASCRGASGAERRAAPFGHTRRPLFSCLLSVAGERARYDVQVLANGCFVAERHRPGRLVSGCGAG